MTGPIPYAHFLGSNDPLPVMRHTYARVLEVSAGLTPEHLRAAPEPGKWSFHDIVRHLTDTELVFQVRLRFILFEDAPHLPAFDQERWASFWSREPETFEQSLERFRVLRESTIRLLEHVPQHDLLRTGTHPDHGSQTAGDYQIILAGHDINHLGQLESIQKRFVTLLR
ncbi:MAG: DinB family protein [Bryobacteraceae bacterium]|nr:DinB family protein [Bryobacteraceae bacterium]